MPEILQLNSVEIGSQPQDRFSQKLGYIPWIGMRPDKLRPVLEWEYGGKSVGLGPAIVICSESKHLNRPPGNVRQHRFRY